MNKLVLVVPARAGSKGFPQKNRMKISGNSLFRNTLELGLKIKKHLSKTHEVIIIPATDDKFLIAENSDLIEFKYIRPDSLSNDQAKLNDLIEDIFKQLHFSVQDVELILIMQPTTPQRTLSGFQEMWRFLKLRPDHSSYISVSLTPFKKYELLEIKNNEMKTIGSRSADIHRQDFDEKIFFEDGAYYLISCKEFFNQSSTQPIPRYYVQAHDAYILDIDTHTEYVCAKSIIEANECNRDN